MNSFGTDFILVTDVRQELPTNTFSGGPWIHLATVKRGFNEYVCFTHKLRHNKTYIEEIDIHTPGAFKKIEDDALWQDLYLFLKDRGCLLIGDFKLANAPSN
jgi:hypothetical protein